MTFDCKTDSAIFSDNIGARGVYKTLVRKRITVDVENIACLEEIAYDNGWIDADELADIYEIYKKNQYGAYLKKIMERKFIDKGVNL